MLQHTATHCNKIRFTHRWDLACCVCPPWVISSSLRTATHCNTLQHTATHCNTLQHTATHCNTLQHTATHCNTMHQTATHCNTLQQTTIHVMLIPHLSRLLWGSWGGVIEFVCSSITTIGKWCWKRSALSRWLQGLWRGSGFDVIIPLFSL